jgi:putative PIN family toxin of toxin-antitoxin system
VLDVGVLVAAHISPRGAPAVVYRAWLGRRFDLVTSPGLLARLWEVLARPKFDAYTDSQSVASYLWVLRRFSQSVPDPEEVAAVPVDPEDDRVVALARASGADILVSGDPHILDAHTGVRVLGPAAFVLELGPAPPEPEL